MLGLALAIVLLNALGLLVGVLSIRGIPFVVIMVLVSVEPPGRSAWHGSMRERGELETRVPRLGDRIPNRVVRRDPVEHRLGQDDLEWGDFGFVMEERLKDDFRRRFPEWMQECGRRIEALDIQDATCRAK